MNKRDLAIYAAGLVTGDFLVGFWLTTAGDLPMNFLGMRLTDQFAMWWMGLDVVLFVGLLYYALNKKKK